VQGEDINFAGAINFGCVTCRKDRRFHFWQASTSPPSLKVHQDIALILIKPETAREWIVAPAQRYRQGLVGLVVLFRRTGSPAPRRCEACCSALATSKSMS
jgi:hypothetical protein